MRGVQERGTDASLSGSRRKSLAVTGAVAAAVAVADQVTTAWAEADIHRPVHLLGPLGLDMQYNSGTAFSLFTGARWWLVPVTALLAAALVWLAWRARSLMAAVGYGLVLGGAVGNLADRLVGAHRGDVADFVTLSHWPTFNVADACITVGIVVVAAGWLAGGADRPTAAGHAKTPDHPGTAERPARPGMAEQAEHREPAS